MEGDLSYDKMLYTFLLDLFLCFLRFYVIMLVCRKRKRKELSLFFSAYVWLFFLLFNRPRHLQRKRSRCVAQFVRLRFSPYFVVVVVVCVIIRWCIATKMFVFYGVAGGEGGPSNVFARELLGQLGVLEEFGMRALVLEAIGSCRRLGTGGGRGGVGATGRPGAFSAGRVGCRRRTARRGALEGRSGDTPTGGVLDKVHLGQVVSVGALGNELGITEGTLHDRIRHDGVVTGPTESQNRTGIGARRAAGRAPRSAASAAASSAAAARTAGAAPRTAKRIGTAAGRGTVSFRFVAQFLQGRQRIESTAAAAAAAGRGSRS